MSMKASLIGHGIAFATGVGLMIFSNHSYSQIGAAMAMFAFGSFVGMFTGNK